MTPEFQHLKYLERGRKPSSRRSHLFKLFKYFPMYNLGIAEVLHHINTEMVVKAIMTVTYHICYVGGGRCYAVGRGCFSIV